MPLRRRIQTFIDRRFYRRKYDAANVLAAFARTARDETDLGVLSAELVRVVGETMQPEFVGLWLRYSQARSETEAARRDPGSPRSLPQAAALLLDMSRKGASTASC